MRNVGIVRGKTFFVNLEHVIVMILLFFIYIYYMCIVLFTKFVLFNCVQGRVLTFRGGI